MLSFVRTKIAGGEVILLAIPVQLALGRYYYMLKLDIITMVISSVSV